MNKLKVISIVLTAIIFLQCSSSQLTKGQNYDTPENETMKTERAQTTKREALVRVNKKLEWNEAQAGSFTVDIKDGDKTVFEVKNSEGGDVRVDAGILSKIFFEIEPDQSSFELNNEWFNKNKAVLIRQCRCVDSGYNMIKSGTISGAKNKDGNWLLQVEVQAEGHSSQKKYPFIFSGHTD